MKILLFGATGSAGASVLRVALNDPGVTEVRAIVRKTPKTTGAKLRVVLHNDFLHYEKVADAFDGIDACLYCIGVSVSQVPKEDDYRRITKDCAVAAAHMLKAHSPKASFHFISGASTSENSRWMWARVKAEAERELMGLVDAACYRPAAIDGETSDSQAKTWYAPLKPLFKVFAPFRSMYISGEDLGRGMLAGARSGLKGTILENAAIRDLADKSA
jgi:uncharacterized protein YbjT (DUF2867 family)